MASQTRAGQPGTQADGCDVDVPSQGWSLLGALGGQQLGELLAVAHAPGLRVPQKQPRNRRVMRGSGVLMTAFWLRRRIHHVAAQLPARRRRPTSATLRWFSR